MNGELVPRAIGTPRRTISRSAGPLTPGSRCNAPPSPRPARPVVLCLPALRLPMPAVANCAAPHLALSRSAPSLCCRWRRLMDPESYGEAPRAHAESATASPDQELADPSIEAARISAEAAFSRPTYVYIPVAEPYEKVSTAAQPVAPSGAACMGTSSASGPPAPALEAWKPGPQACMPSPCKPHFCTPSCAMFAQPICPNAFPLGPAWRWQASAAVLQAGAVSLSALPAPLLACPVPLPSPACRTPSRGCSSACPSSRLSSSR